MLENIRESSQSLWVKIAFGIIIVVFVFWGIGTFTPNAGLVASVNGQDITEQEFIQAYNAQIQQLQSILPDMELNEEMLKGMNLPYYALETLITQTLLEQEAKRTGFEIGARELIEAISTFPFAQDANGNFSREAYMQTFENAGQSPKAFETLLQKEMREGKFRTLFSTFANTSEEQAKNIFEYQNKAHNFEAYYIADSAFINSVSVSDEDLQAVYDRNIMNFQLPANLKLEYIEINSTNLSKLNSITDAEIQAEYDANRALYDLPESVTASHILIAVPSTATASIEEEALAKIKDIEAKLNAGGNFANLAREFSDDTGTASRGGSLGAFTRGQMVPEFEEVAFNTPVNAISSPVRSNFGYHIIKVEAKQAAAPRDEKTTRDMIRADLARLNAITNMQSAVDSILVQVHSNKDNANLQAIAEKEGLKVQNTALLSIEEIARNLGLEASDAQLLSQAPVNTVLDNALFTQDGYIIAKVVENEPARTRTFEEVKSSLVSDAKKLAAHNAALAKAEESLANTNSIARTNIKTYQIARNGIFPLGSSVELAQDIFNSSENSPWLDKVYPLEDGYIIAKPTTIVPVNPSLWQSQKAAQLEHMRTTRENLLYALYVRQLRADADIKILNQAYFQ